MHVHDDHSSDGSLPRQASDDRLPGNMSITDQIGIAQLRALNFLPLTDHRTYDQHYDPLWRSDSLLLIPGEEANGAPHATVHGAVDTVVQGADVAGAPARRSLQQSIWDAHLQDAVWITAHPDDGEVDEQGQPNDFADAVGIDAVEVWNKASNAEIEIDYSGWTPDGRLFDSSVTRGEKALFQLRQLIAGWQEGVRLMSRGDTYRFWIPGHLAYDSQPGGNSPKGMLVFDITLYDFSAGTP